jgi:WD40 repeat protein
MDVILGVSSSNPGCKKNTRKLVGPGGKVTDVYWQDEKTLFSIGQDGFAIQWDAANTKKLGQFQTKSNFMMTIASNKDMSCIATGGLDNNCTLYKNMEGTIAATLEHEGYVGKARFQADGKLLTASGDAKIYQWDVTAPSKSLLKFEGHKDGSGVDSLAFKDEAIFATGAADKTCHIWDSRAGGKPVTSCDNRADVNDVCFSGNGNGICTAGYDGVCRYFDARWVGKAETELVQTYKCPKVGKAECLSMALSKDGSVVFAGYNTDKGSMAAFNAIDGTMYELFEWGKAGMAALETSPDGYGLACGSWDTIQFTNIGVSPHNGTSIWAKPAKSGGACVVA